MYTIAVKIVGVAPLLQHRFPIETSLADPGPVTGKKDYSEEWRVHLYTDGKTIYQPSSHIESAMVESAVNFRIPGKGRKSYKDLFRSCVFVSPERIPHNVEAPKELDTDADKELYLDARPVVINRARIVRIRPAFKPGWSLEFEIEVIDDSIPAELVQGVLELAGKTKGIGDYRPKFGRFRVARFEVLKTED